MDWGQGIFRLKDWIDESGVGPVNVACHTPFTMIYGPKATLLPVFPGQVGTPRLPGYVAVSSSVVRGIGGRKSADYYAPFLRMEPVARIGNSIKIYRVDRPWWNQRR